MTTVAKNEFQTANSVLSTTTMELTTGQVSLTTVLLNVTNFNCSECVQNITSGNDLALVEVSTYLWRIISLVFIVVGMAGNILNLAVLKRMRFWLKPSLFFLVPLAFTDMTVLCSGLTRYWVLYSFDFDLRTLSNTGCKINLFIIYFSMQFSSWILVCITSERFLKINFPFRYRSYVTVKKQGAILCVICVLLVGVNVHFFITNGLYTDIDTNESVCSSLTEEYFYFDEHVFTIIDLVILSAFPAISMIIMNINIRIALKKSTKFRDRSVIGTTFQYRQFNAKLTQMLFFTSTYFVVTTVPISIYFIVDTYVKADTKMDEARKELAWTIIYLFQFSNYSVNFILYTFFSPRFRSYLKVILCGWKTNVNLLRTRGNSKNTSSLGSSMNTVSSRVDYNENDVTNTETVVPSTNQM